MTDRRTNIAIAVTCTILAALILLAVYLDIPKEHFLLKEGGVVESASALGYLFCVALILHKGGTAFLRSHHHLLLIVIFFMLRELDFDKRFTTMGIFKSRFLISDNVPFAEKFFGAAVILLLLYSILSTIILHSRDFCNGLKSRSTICLGVLVVAILLVISKTLDGLARKAIGIGIEVGESISRNASAVEEILELGIPVIVFLTFSAYFKRIKNQAVEPNRRKQD